MRGAWIAVGTAAFSWLLLLSVEYSRPQYEWTKRTDCTYQESNGNQKSTTTPLAPIIDKNVATQLQQRTSASEDKTAGKKQDFWDRPSATDYAIAFFSFCSLLVGGAQWRTYRKQAKIMQDTLDSQGVASARQYDLADKNAKATLRAAKAAEDTVKGMERTERPYALLGGIFGIIDAISIANAAATFPQEQMRPEHVWPSVRFTVSNGGKAPAIIKEMKFNLAFIDEIPSTPNYSDCQIMQGEHVIFAGKQSTEWFNYFEGASLKTMEDHDDFRSGKRWYFLYGYVKYTDVFGNEYISGFGMRALCDRTPNVFFTVGGEAYNYRT